MTARDGRKAVDRIFTRFVFADTVEEEQLRSPVCVAVTQDHDQMDRWVLYVLFKDGTWTSAAERGYAGAIGGYNAAAMWALPGLEQLGLISEAESDAWLSWLHSTRKRRDQRVDQARMESLAEQYGYTLTKTKRRRG